MSNTPDNSRSVTLSQAVEVDSDGFSRIHADDVLAPGYYWQAKSDITAMDTTWNRVSVLVHKGDVLLLLDVFEFDGAAHSVELLDPPSNGGYRTHKLLIEEFFAKMEPCHDAEAIRAKEQREIMDRVQALQEDMAQAEINPLALPGVKESADKAIAEFEREEEQSAVRNQQTDTERNKALHRIHRRAARRSESAGNPLVTQNVIVSNQLSDMIDGGVTSDGLKELTLESRRRTAVATATAKWLTSRAEAIGNTMKELTPYYAERAKVALARSKKAIRYAEDISKGLKSLELYTGDGVDVLEVRQGLSAPTTEPLTLVQGKRFMAEEVAVFADVGDNFDYRDQSKFFDLLSKSDALRDQVFPTSRCVVSMAVNRHTVRYGEKVSAYEQAMRDAANRLVFLLVRDGNNIHAVYSTEPSHEAAARLFPSDEDINRPFTGIDGTKIKLKDVAFSAASERFDDLALHYKRFLILLCGLDHRLHLMGEFYPPENGLQFMSQPFQAKYFRFLEDDGRGFLLETAMEGVEDWMARCNASLRSGSRVMLTAGATVNSPHLTRLSEDYAIISGDLTSSHVVQREGKHHYVTVTAKAKYAGNVTDAKIWLDGPQAKAKTGHYFLCLDLVRLPVIHRYIHSRLNRSTSIGWIRIFKQIEKLLSAELITQEELRSHLRTNAMAHGGLNEEQVDEAIEMGIMSWRASHRGATAPELADTKAVNEILTLMYPSEKIVQSIDSLLNKLIAEKSLTPLRLSRTGKTRLALYVTPTDEDKVPYAPGCHWGWVKRLVIDPLKTKLTIASSTLVWLEKDKVDPTEEEMRSWPELDAWLNEHPEPVALLRLEKFTSAMHNAYSTLNDILKGQRFTSLNEPLPADLFEEIRERFATYYRSATANSSLARLSVPVGVYQSKPGVPVSFIHMQCNALGFVQHYGSDIQADALKLIVKRYGYEKRNSRENETSLSWTLTTTAAPFSHWVTDAAQRHPDFSLVRIQKNALPSLFNSHRGKGNGKPNLTSEMVALSFNRSFEALMQKAPHVKRKFYWNLQEQINREKTFPDFHGKRDEAIKNLRLQSYKPDKSCVSLSPFVWDEKRGRSLAGCWFAKAKK